MTDLAKMLILFGVVLIAAGSLILAAGRIPWVGRLPGDVMIRRNGFFFYFPLGSCLAASVLLSLLLYLFRR